MHLWCYCLCLLRIIASIAHDEMYENKVETELRKNKAELENRFGNGILASGHALHFDGVRDYFYMESDEFRDRENVTLSVWLQLDSYDPKNKSLGGLFFVVGHPFNNGVRLMLKSNGNSYFVHDYHRFWKEIPGAACDHAESKDRLLKPDVWYHVALTANRDFYRLYLNGRLIMDCYTIEEAKEIARHIELRPQSSRIHLGIMSRNDRTHSNAFRGCIDEVLYLKREVTQEAVQQMMAGRLPKEYFKDILAFSSFDNIQGSFTHYNTRWRTKSGRDSKLVPSNARVVGNFIVGIEVALEPVDPLEKNSLALQLTEHQAACNGEYKFDADSVAAGRWINKTQHSQGSKIRYIPETGCIGQNKLSLYFEMYDQNVVITMDILNNSMPIAGGGGNTIRCDGVDDFLYNEDFTLPVSKNGAGPVTIEYWANSPFEARHNGAIMSIGNGASNEPWAELLHPYRSYGRFDISGPNEAGRVQALIGTRSSTSVNIATTFGRWTHYAITHEQANGTSAKIYVNGVLQEHAYHDHIAVGQDRYNLARPTSKWNQPIKGLTLCTYTFYSGLYHQGYLDEFRIWKTIRTQEEIVRHMHQNLPNPKEEDDLLAYYTFDEENNTRDGIAPDSSRNGYHLKYGGCAPCSNDTGTVYKGFSPLLKDFKNQKWFSITDIDANNSIPGDLVCQPSASDGSSPNFIDGVVYGGHPCYYIDEEGDFARQPSENWPVVKPSHAPIGGQSFEQFVIPRKVQNSIILNATDPDTDDQVKLMIIITRMPDPKYGKLGVRIDGKDVAPKINERLPLNHKTVLFYPVHGVGGKKIANFSYAITDGVLHSKPSVVYVSILCEVGQFVNAQNECESCPSGTYSDNQNLERACKPCRHDEYQPNPGSRECNVCQVGSFVDPTATTCQPCSPNFKPKPGPFPIRENGCPVTLQYVVTQKPSDIVLQMADTIDEYIDRGVKVGIQAMLTSLPAKGTIYQYSSQSTPLSTKKRDPLKWHRGNEEGISQYASEVLDECGQDVSDGRNDTLHGILGPPRLKSSGKRSRNYAWGVCERTNKFAYSYNSIVLKYKQAIFLTKIIVSESYLPGSLLRIEAWQNSSSSWIKLWNAIPRSTGTEYSTTPITQLCVGPEPVDRLRITTQILRTGAPSQLEAVLITGMASKEQLLSVAFTDPEMRFIYSYNANSSDSLPTGKGVGTTDNFFDKFSVKLRRCTTGGITENQFTVILRLHGDTSVASPPTSRDSLLAFVFFIPMIMLMGIMVVHLRRQGAKRKILHGKLEDARNTIPESALLKKHEVQLTRELGRGACGIVHLAMYRGMTVAVKRLTSYGLHASAVMKDEIEVESRRMLELRHPNIVIFMGCCLDANSPFIMSQYCERGSLYDILQNAALDLPWCLRLRLAVGATRGLLYLHSATPPLIHRDVKSPNILVDESWTAKLADFGTLEVVKVLKAGREKQSNSNDVGTVRWTAPEILLGKAMKEKGYPERAIRLIQYTPAIDVYSVGVVLWEIATRELPYSHLNFMHQVEEEVLTGNGLQVCEDPSEWPYGYSQLVTQCLQWDPAKRPMTIDVLRCLEKMLKDEESNYDRSVLQSLRQLQP